MAPARTAIRCPSPVQGAGQPVPEGVERQLLGDVYEQPATGVEDELHSLSGRFRGDSRGVGARIAAVQ